jgi:hypothetical protein
MTDQQRDQTRARPVQSEDGLTRRARVLATVERTPPKLTRSQPSAAPEVGKWNQALYLEYKAAKEGPRKRHLLNQLIEINTPLAKLICDQMCGRGDGSRRKGYKPMGGLQGARDLEWDDALQASRLALQKALEQFDPSKRLDKHGNPNPYKPGEDFKISGYLKSKIRHEIQRLIWYGGSLIRVPRGNGVDPIGVALVGEEQTMDLLSGGYEDTASVSELGITPEMIAEWERTGEWPESLEELRESMRKNEEEPEDEPDHKTAPAVMLVPPAPPRVFMSGIEAFLSNRVAIVNSARVETWTAHNAYRLECRKEGFEEADRPVFVRWMERSGFREVFIRSRQAPSTRALAGIRLLGR